MNEFEDIKGFENLYRINKSGEIWSCIYNKVMKHQTTEDGYLFVRLAKPKTIENNIVKRNSLKGFIHRLLALQYIENPENLPQIDHIDRNKQNNNLDNLRWCSQHTNRLNRSDILANKTEEEMKEYIEKCKKYQRDWAKQKRENMTEEDKEKLRNNEKNKKYKSDWAKQKRENMTEEEREKRRNTVREFRARPKAKDLAVITN